MGRIVGWPFCNYSGTIRLFCPCLNGKSSLASEACQLISLDVTSESDPYVMADPLLQFGHGLQGSHFRAHWPALIGLFVDIGQDSYNMSCEIAVGHPSYHTYHPLYLACFSSCEELILALPPLHLAEALR